MRTVLCVVMDGIGRQPARFGNAVAMARTPSMDFLSLKGLTTSLKAHGPWVGLPGEHDIGNSEVGHNALGAGRIFDQGAKLVQNALNSGAIFQGKAWKKLSQNCLKNNSCLHFIGLLSDGNVHSHEQHLFQMLAEAGRGGIRKIRIHPLFDGRDVPPRSAELHLERLEQTMAPIRASGIDIQIASGGGRMTCTMDRYGADWDMVRHGWQIHVLGKGPRFSQPRDAIRSFRDQGLTDQYFPGFVIADASGPVGAIEDGDSVIFFNFRGDRAIEISQAFDEKNFTAFPRERIPKVCYAGMMEYDGDLHIPAEYLVAPPAISDTLGEHLACRGIRQFACSETQKFGHVTYFWNGNRSGRFDDKTEEYLEIRSDKLPFDQAPWMKAREITRATTDRMRQGCFRFGRINYANGDMVGHTGNLEASILAVATVDLMLSELIRCANETKTILLITADHGNCDEMFFGKEADFPDWDHPGGQRPEAKTSHTLSQVPVYLYDPRGFDQNIGVAPPGKMGLASVANTALELMGLPCQELYEPSLLSTQTP